MIYSMTGFASVKQELANGAINVEFRSVNHRYLDIQFRMPDELRLLEQPIREQVQQALTRGKVDCRLSFAKLSSTSKGLQPNLELLEQLLALNDTVKEKLPESRDLSVAEILHWPGMLDDTTFVEGLQEAWLALIQRALSDLSATRGREGEKLAQMLLDRVQRMEELVTEVAPRIPELLNNYREKLGARLREAMVSHDDERVRQELALFAAKIDVAEELNRLQTHLSEIRRILAKGGPVGKRLDFLMQELNREANTLGSKSVDSEVSKTAMELKVLIEQMREQIQNIE